MTLPWPPQAEEPRLAVEAADGVLVALAVVAAADAVVVAPLLLPVAELRLAPRRQVPMLLALPPWDLPAVSAPS